MNLVESLKRGLNWLTTPHYIEPRLDMETRPFRRMPLELEIVYCSISKGDATVKFPMTMMVLPKGSSPVQN
ncbi:hypothetical protein A5647_19760 [Mycobacterium sp. 1100029.7]|nr:hypothetical protein A5647_19760 [Mycobacterium sp. 1100029.7]